MPCSVYIPGRTKIVLKGNKVVDVGEMGIWEVGTERIGGRGNLSGYNICKNKRRKMIPFPTFSFPCVFYEAVSNKLNWNFVLGSFFDSDFMINDYLCLFLFNMLKEFLENFPFSFQNSCVQILLAGYRASCTNYQVILYFLHFFYSLMLCMLSEFL